ncbi:dehydrogenase [Serratia marcescens]|uniref:dehydrogenase n=1 Tax=Serratia marcescens TaxID=615 RepID=UPI003EE14091
MNPYNVNVKTAAAESAERCEKAKWCESETPEPWEKPGVQYPAAVRALEMEFMYLGDLDDLYAQSSTSPDELEQALYVIFGRMTELVQSCGADYKQPDKPRVSYEMAKYWIRGQRVAQRCFGEIGQRAWEHARYRLAQEMAVEYSYN